jgi:hypothetical protein
VTEPTRIGEYSIYEAIASGGMASVHFGRFAAHAGLTRTVAVKRMHPHLAKDPDFVAMFVDEARLAARIRHPNVVATLDVLAASDELLIVMEYVHGEPLADLVQEMAVRRARMPPPIACALVADLLSGLHAAHEATDDHGQSLGIVHRDVNPENVLVGADGIARVLDFGVAKAVGRLQVTREGHVKGKIAYMAPEQVRGAVVSRATDTYSAAVVLWELLAGRRLFDGGRDAELIEKILFGAVDAPSAVMPNVPEQVNAVVLRGLARDPSERFQTARDMVRALREAVRPASASEVSDWVESIAGETLARRAATLAAIDRDDSIAETLAPATTARPGPVGLGPPARRGRAGLLTMAIAALGVVGIFLARSPSAPGADDRRWPSASVAATVAVGPASASAPAPAPAPASAPAPAPAPAPASASAPASAVAPSIRGGAAPPPPKAATRPRPLSPPPDGAACDPPYTTDADGTRHYKLKCL